MKILDLGCGATKEKGAIGVEILPLEGVDLIADLSKPPYPFRSNSFDVFYFNDVIEHLPNTIATMEEVYRLARPDARVLIRVVNWNSHYTAMDPTHVRAFTENSFDFFGKRVGRSYYTQARFDVERVGYQFNVQVKRVLRSKRLMKFLSFYLNNILEGLNFELRAIKDDTKSQLSEEKDWANLFAVLRCPHCVVRDAQNPESDSGRLELFQGCWLVCQEDGCGRKYPVFAGLPFMLRTEGERWMDVPAQDLPVPPPGKGERIQASSNVLRGSYSDSVEIRSWKLRRRHVVMIALLAGVGLGYAIAQIVQRILR